MTGRVRNGGNLAEMGRSMLRPYTRHTWCDGFRW
jgi:hypothetical protein